MREKFGVTRHPGRRRSKILHNLLRQWRIEFDALGNHARWNREHDLVGLHLQSAGGLVEIDQISLVLPGNASNTVRQMQRFGWQLCRQFAGELCETVFDA